MGALEVNALASRIRREQYLYVRVMLERLLRLHPRFSPHTTMDHYNGVLAAEERGYTVLKIAQCVSVLGE